MAYSKAKWKKARADYESGTIKSVEELHEKHGISIRQIETKINKEGWEKGKNSDKIEEKIEEKTIDMLARLGMPKEKVMKILINGLKDPTIVKFEGKGDQMMATPMPDYKTIKDYIQEYNKMTGGYAAEKKEISGDPENPISIQQITRKIIKGK